MESSSSAVRPRAAVLVALLAGPADARRLARRCLLPPGRVYAALRACREEGLLEPIPPRYSGGRPVQPYRLTGEGVRAAGRYVSQLWALIESV